MINVLENRTIKRSGDFEETEFTIDSTNPAAYEILSSTLYSDPELAVIRELSTNCEDAHIQVGQTIPWELTLPTYFAPTLKFRDFGPGLSDKEIKEVYTKYFRSTKANSNDVTGMLGLGSKSPLALDTAFTVSSYQNGLKNIYTVYKSERHIPQIALLNTENTSEANGLEISIPVKKGDCDKFKERAQKVLIWFKNKPKCSLQFPQITGTAKDNYIMGHNLNIHPYYFANCAIMGNVCYPIALEHFPNKDILTSNIIIYFDIGDLDISASREKLQYTTKTKTKIGAILNKIELEITDELNKRIADSPYHLAANILRQELSAKFRFLKLVDNWKGKKFLSYVTLDDTKVKIEQKTWKKWEVLDTLYCQKDLGNLYVDDLDRGAKSRIENANNYGTHTLLKFLTPDGEKYFEDTYGLPVKGIQLASALAEPVRATVVRAKTVKVMEFVPQSTTYNPWVKETEAKYWQNATIDPAKTYDYVDINRSKWVWDKKEHSPRLINTIITYLRHENLCKTVYGVRSSYSKKVKKNWNSVAEIFFKNFETNFNKDKGFDIIHAAVLNQSDIKALSMHGVTNPALKSIQDETLDYLLDSATLAKASLYQTTLETYNLLVTSPLVDTKKRRTVDEIKKDIVKIKPMLEYVSMYNWSKQSVVDYLNS